MELGRVFFAGSCVQVNPYCQISPHTISGVIVRMGILSDGSSYAVVRGGSWDYLKILVPLN